MKSLDPRVQRLPSSDVKSDAKETFDQLETFEVFVQPKEGKPFQHEGSVHAPNLEMAFILAKENFTRRFTCVSLWVAETSHVAVSSTTEGAQNVYDQITRFSNQGNGIESYEVFHLTKRGRQHIHFRTVDARDPEEAMANAREFIPPEIIFYNVWAIRTRDIRVTSEEEKDLWTTLPDKKFRDAAAYKGGDKLKEFLEKNQPQNL